MAPSPAESRVAQADDVAVALCRVWERLAGTLAGAWCERRGGAIASVTGADIPTLNGVWAHSASPDPEAVDDLLDRVAGAGLPYCLQLRPGPPAEAVARAEKRGLVLSETVPLMVLDVDGAIDSALDGARHVAGLTLRQLAPDEAELHVITAATGFGEPEIAFRHLVTPALLSLPGVRCYIGEAGGHPVTTGIGVSFGGAVGIFNIATPPEHRGRGYAAAVTARAARDGLDSGDRYAFLQSSSEGLPVYRRLGFRTLEEWHCWLSGGDGDPAAESAAATGAATGPPA
jgi:hypothetical protein